MSQTGGAGRLWPGQQAKIVFTAGLGLCMGGVGDSCGSLMRCGYNGMLSDELTSQQVTLTHSPRIHTSANISYQVMVFHRRLVVVRDGQIILGLDQEVVLMSGHCREVNERNVTVAMVADSSG